MNKHTPSYLDGLLPVDNLEVVEIEEGLKFLHFKPKYWILFIYLSGFFFAFLCL